MPQKYWKDTVQYQRILEVLEDYWLTEKDEDKVVITMEFYKGKEEQHKQITWVNPNRKAR